MKKTKQTISLVLIIMMLITIAIPAFAAPGILGNFAGAGDTGYKDGGNIEAQFIQPYGLAVDLEGGIIIVDSLNHRIRLSKDNTVTTIAGFSDKKDSFGLPLGGMADGDALKAKFSKPRDAVVDSKGNIFISDTGNNAIRKISSGKVYTVAGNGEAGYKDGKGTEARFYGPSGIAIDANDNLYVADSMNNMIRKITPKGEVTTLAGSVTAGFKQGMGATSLFNEPSDVKIDKNGVVYILDCGNQLVRKLKDGNVSTIAGTRGALIQDTGYYEGGILDGFDAQFNFPKGFDIAEDGTIFVADTWNHRIRAIKTTGETITIAGTGVPGKKSGTLVDAMLNGPVEVLYHHGIIYISDIWNNMIRSIPVTLGSLTSVANKEEMIKGIKFAPRAQDIQVWVDKNYVKFPDVKPQLVNTKTLVPLRFICESWGAEVTWLQATNQVEIKKESFKKVFSLNAKNITVINGRTMIQVRDLAESMGFSVVWVDEYRAAVIATK